MNGLHCPNSGLRNPKILSNRKTGNLNRMTVCAAPGRTGIITGLICSSWFGIRRSIAFPRSRRIPGSIITLCGIPGIALPGLCYITTGPDLPAVGFLVCSTQGRYRPCIPGISCTGISRIFISSAAQGIALIPLHAASCIGRTGSSNCRAASSGYIAFCTRTCPGCICSACTGAIG